jgi:PTH1 family peptidyl-tRNA hydrolase
VENRYLIAGLGNPGREYERTRHNAGFLVLDLLARLWKADWTTERKFHARVARIERDGKRVFLCQPGTFMNSSGEAVGPLMDFHKIPPERLMVAVDDADLPIGEIRLRSRGSSGGHHGLESIEQHLGTRDFPRQRLGIGREAGGRREITGYVLAPFRAGEQKLLEKVLQKACEQIECWLASGIGPAMNRFNGVINI